MESVKGLHKRLLVVLNLFAIVLLASACQGQTTTTVPTATPTSIGSPTPTPTPTLGHCNSNLLPGHLLLFEQISTIVSSNQVIHELTCTTTGTIQDRVIASEELLAEQPTISPDGRFLRYILGPVPGSIKMLPDPVIANAVTETAEFEAVSQNLQTGAKNTSKITTDYDSSTFPCISWSPSGTQLSYNANGALFVENIITGTHRVLVQEPSQEYTFGQLFGGIDCGDWISDDILLFHRFTGTFPFEIDGGGGVPADTTTLALLHEGTLADTPGLLSLSVVDISQDRKYVLLDDKESNRDSWKLVKTSDFTSFAAVRAAHQITCANCTLLGFVPNSDEVYGYQLDSLSSSYIGLVFVDARSLSVQYGPTGKPTKSNTDHGGLEVIQWGGTPDNVIVSYDYFDKSYSVNHSGYYGDFAVASIRSGEIDLLIEISNSHSYILLGWVP